MYWKIVETKRRTIFDIGIVTKDFFNYMILW